MRGSVPLLGTVLVVAWSSVAAADEAIKNAVCNFSLPNMAESVYCSVWRTKCGLPTKSETKEEIIDRLYLQQQAMRYPIGPPVRHEDVETLLYESLDFGDDRYDDPSDARKQFANRMKSKCLAEFDGVQKEHERQSITR